MSTDDFFRARLETMIDMRHSLAVLATRMPWKEIEAALAPVLVPMLMLLGISPEMTTAAYRMGDSSVNMASPLMPYFALVLGFCQRWRPGFGVGGLISAMLPYSAAMMSAGLLLTGLWATLELPLGPQAPVHYSPPEAITR